MQRAVTMGGLLGDPGLLCYILKAGACHKGARHKDSSLSSHPDQLQRQNPLHMPTKYILSIGKSTEIKRGVVNRHQDGSGWAQQRKF